MLRHPSGDDCAGFPVGLGTVDLPAVARMVGKTMLGDPIAYRPLDRFLHPPVEPVGFDGIEMGGHAGGLDQPAQRKISHARVLQPAIDPQTRNLAPMDMERRAFVDGPLRDGTAIGLAVLIVGEQPLDERQGEAGDTIVGGEMERDLAASAQAIGQPIHGAAENGHAASFREITMACVESGSGDEGAARQLKRLGPWSACGSSGWPGLRQAPDGLGGQQGSPADLDGVEAAGFYQGVNR